MEREPLKKNWNEDFLFQYFHENRLALKSRGKTKINFFKFASIKKKKNKEKC